MNHVPSTTRADQVRGSVALRFVTVTGTVPPAAGRTCVAGVAERVAPIAANGFGTTASEKVWLPMSRGGQVTQVGSARTTSRATTWSPSCVGEGVKRTRPVAPSTVIPAGAIA